MEADGTVGMESPGSQNGSGGQPSVVERSTEVVRNLIERLGEGGRPEHRAAWESVQSPDVINLMVEAWLADEPQMMTALTMIEMVPRQVQRARQYRRTIETLANEIRRRRSDEMLAEIEEQLGELPTIDVMLDGGAPPPSIVTRQVLSTLRAPRGFEIDFNGVYRLAGQPDGTISRTRIALSPIFIAGRTVDVLSGETKRLLVWRGASGWRSRVVERRTIVDTSKIIMLSNWDAPVSTNNTLHMVSYLSEFDAENAGRFPVVQSASSMGWQPDGGFLLPDAFYSSDTNSSRDFSLTPPTGLETLAGGWKTKGTWDQWLDAMRLVQDFPYMYIAAYASAAAPLLEVLRIPGFVLDFSGETSGGKTTALRFAASVWGRPAESYPTAMYSWDATKVWIERTSGFLKNLPLILDETKRARHTRIVRDVIYDFCQGQGRGRGSIDGTRHTESWRSILISSGEGAATSFSQDAGTRARVLSLKGKPLGDDVVIGSAASEEAQALLANTYGHLGRKMVEYLVANTERHGDIRGVFQVARQKYSELAGSAVARRHAGHLAVLEVTASIVHSLGVPQPRVDPFTSLLESQEHAGHDADRPLSALQDFLTWCAVNQKRFWGRGERDREGNTRSPSQGWVGAWEEKQDWDTIAVTTTAFNELMRDLGHEPDEIISRWNDRQWLKRSGGRQRARSRVVRVDGAPTRCYCIDRNAADMAIESE
jgi:putative DNA primase/helicase